MPFKPSIAQQRFYDWVENERGNCILNAVAGAGKTTTIMHGIERMRGTVWFGVYNKKMADEIKEKLAGNKKLAKRAQFKAQEQVTASTFHSLGSSLVKSMTYPNKADVDDKKVQRIVDSIILEKEGVSQEPRHDLRDLSGAIVRLVSMAKNRGFVPADRVRDGLTNWDDVKAWHAMADHFDIGDTLDLEQVDTAISFARVVLRRSTSDMSTIDFDDMVYLPLARKIDLKPWHRYNWVLIDEAQDTNPTRRALASLVLAPGGRLVAVGDPNQAIYGFTGADNDSLEQIRDAFNAIELPLTTTYRCPKNVVAHARNWVSHIEAHEANIDGEVRTEAYADFLDALPGIDRAAYGETAILCRFNKYLVGLCFKMIRMGLPAKIEGRAIGDGLVKLATRWKSAKTVNGLESKLREYEAREIAKAQARDNEAKVDRIVDEVATLMTIIERVRAAGKDRVTDVTDAIDEIFEDGVAGKGMITLCSAHKSKGLEWDTVNILDREALMPSKRAKKEWELAQEANLIYVAVTRAKQTLVEVTGVVEEKDPTKGEA